MSDATTTTPQKTWRIVFQHIRLGDDLLETFEVRAAEEYEARRMAWTQLGYTRCTNWFRLKEVSVVG